MTHAILIRATYPEPFVAVLGPGDQLPAPPKVGEEVSPANGHTFTLDELQSFVGGFIEFYALADGRQMVGNEEAKILRLPVNVEATILFRDRRAWPDTICGDVLVCPPELLS